MTPNVSDFYHQYGYHCMSTTTACDPFLSFKHPLGEMKYQHIRIPILGMSCVAVVGDPLCAPHDKVAVLTAFLKAFPDACFYHVYPETAAVLKALGCQAYHMGTESHLCLRHLKWSYPFRRHIKTPLPPEIVITESSATPYLKDIQMLHQKWLQSKRHKRENALFLTKPFSPLPDVRCFFAWKGDTLVGFRSFDPLWRHHVCLGYYADCSYFLEESPKDLSYHMLSIAVQTFQDEGRLWLTMGLSPFCESGHQAYSDSVVIHRIFRFFYSFLNRLYSFKGLSQFKRTVSAVSVPIYFVSARRHVYFNLWGVLWHIFKT